MTQYASTYAAATRSYVYNARGNITRKSRDSDPEVAAWARAREEEFEVQLDREIAAEEFERRRA